MGMMHFTELNSTTVVNYCTGCGLALPLPLALRPLAPYHAKIDVPDARRRRYGATKAREDPQRTPIGG